MASVIPSTPHWPTGTLLAFSHLDGPTDFANGLVARAVPGGIDVRIPDLQKIRFFFPGENIRQVHITSDWFEISDGSKPVCRGVMLDAWHLLVEGPCTTTAPSDRIRIHVTNSLPARLLVGSAGHFNPELIHTDIDDAVAARRRWLNTQAANIGKNLPSGTRATLLRALSQMKGQACSPEGILQHPWTTPDRWPHRDIWLWDSVFHAAGWRHLDARLAAQMIEAVLDLQSPDGFIPHHATPWKHSRITQPPVLALGVELVWEKTGDLEWLDRLFPKIAACLEWNARNRDTDGDGLLEWHIDAMPDSRSGESGMDNSPRFDEATLLGAPDFNAYQASEYECLSRFAKKLGRDTEAAHWAARHAELCARINRKLWSEAHGFYCDWNPSTNALSDVLACSGFLPLICGAPDARMAARLATHLGNPATFGTAFPVASVAVSDTARFSKDMWRGPAWISTNWLIARGFRRYGLHATADRLVQASLRKLERTVTRWGTFFEYFDSKAEIEPPFLLRKRKNIPGTFPHQAIEDFGWSATLYADWIFSGNNAS
ncbi:neutral trehalase [Opitutaceae bacterium TAV1]|nr:neutral trehalase [Opitutaceae bacterium TAV1]